MPQMKRLKELMLLVSNDTETGRCGTFVPLPQSSTTPAIFALIYRP
jgi:hypothetical protein